LFFIINEKASINITKNITLLNENLWITYNKKLDIFGPFKILFKGVVFGLSLFYYAFIYDIKANLFWDVGYIFWILGSLIIRSDFFFPLSEIYFILSIIFLIGGIIKFMSIEFIDFVKKKNH